MTDVQTALLLFFLFNLKHLIVDFFVQNRFPYMWMNKHKFLHPGGWLHAGGHGLASIVVLYPWLEVSFPYILFLCFMETLIHFWIDCVKMNVGILTGWKCNTSPYFWDLLGVDQFLHQATYIWMIYVWSTAL